MKRVILAGGGTGGHLYPGVAVADALVEKGYEVLFLVSDRGIEKKVLSDKGYAFVEQSMTPLRGRGAPGLLKGLVSLVRQTIRTTRLINRSDTVLLTGGFAAAPAAIGASLRRAPVYLHEQNAVMGMTNRLFAPLARKVFVNTQPTKKAPKRAIAVGYPVRRSLVDVPVKDTMDKRILVTGGSQGSRFINTLVAEAAPRLVEDGWAIRHQTGGKLYDETIDMYRRTGLDRDDAVSVTAYIDDMAEALGEADIVIARAGAGGVAETMAAKRPAVFIPFAAAADDHQAANAAHAVNAGVARMLREHEADKNALINALNDMHQRYETDIRSRLASRDVPDAVKLIIEGMKL